MLSEGWNCYFRDLRFKYRPGEHAPGTPYKNIYLAVHYSEWVMKVLDRQVSDSYYRKLWRQLAVIRFLVKQKLKRVLYAISIVKK